MNLPRWADKWANGTCGCGSRLVTVQTQTGQDEVVCSHSGWSTDRCGQPGGTE